MSDEFNMTPEADAALEARMAANARPGACPPPNALIAANEGVLPEDVAAEIRAHVESCSLCRTLLAELGPEAATLTAEQDARIRSAILRTIGPRGLDATPATTRIRRAWPALLAVAAVLLLAVSGVFSYRATHHAATTASVAPAIALPAPIEFAELHQIAPLPPPEGSALVTRGGSGSSATPSTVELLPAFRAYNRGDFAAAAKQFAPLATRYPQADIPTLYLGVAQLELGENAEARTSLGHAREVAAPDHRDAAAWYLAIALLRTGDVQQTLPLLQSVCSSPQSGYAPRACAIASQLRLSR